MDLIEKLITFVEWVGSSCSPCDCYPSSAWGRLIKVLLFIPWMLLWVITFGFLVIVVLLPTLGLYCLYNYVAYGSVDEDDKLKEDLENLIDL